MPTSKIALIVLASIQIAYNIGAFIYLCISSRRKK